VHAKIAAADAELARIQALPASGSAATAKLAEATARIAVAAADKVEKAKGMLQTGVIVKPATTMSATGRPATARGYDQLPIAKLVSGVDRCDPAGKVVSTSGTATVTGLQSTSSQIAQPPQEILGMSYEMMRANDDNLATNYLVPRLAAAGVNVPEATVRPAPDSQTRRLPLPHCGLDPDRVPSLQRTLTALAPEFSRNAAKMGLSQKQFADMYDAIIRKLINFELHGRLALSEFCLTLEETTAVRLDEHPKLEQLLTHTLEMMRQSALAVTTESLVALKLIHPTTDRQPAPAIFPINSAVHTANTGTADARLAEHGKDLQEAERSGSKRKSSGMQPPVPKKPRSAEVSPSSVPADGAAATGTSGAAGGTRPTTTGGGFGDHAAGTPTAGAGGSGGGGYPKTAADK
jgi:hypothetical protein